MSLRTHLKTPSARPTFGMNVYSGAPAVVEIAGHHGLDFVFIDAEHTALGLDLPMERMILAAKLAGTAPLVRVPDSTPTALRKALEMGAEGAIIPQVHDGAQMRSIIAATKFPPMGRRGGDSSVRSANYGGSGFDWVAYAAAENERTVIIPMAESYEFFDNIDEILAVEGIDAVHFGPADYALSRGLTVDYSMRHPVVRDAMRLLIQKCHARGIKVMLPCAPATLEQCQELIAEGGDMILLGNDMGFIHAGCSTAKSVIDKLNLR